MIYEKGGEVMVLSETPDACVERLKQLEEEFHLGCFVC